MVNQSKRLQNIRDVKKFTYSNKITDESRKKADQLLEWYKEGKLNNIKQVEKIIRGLDDKRTKAQKTYKDLDYGFKPYKTYHISGSASVLTKYRHEKKYMGTTVYSYKDTLLISNEKVKAKSEEEAEKHFVDMFSKNNSYDFGDDEEEYYKAQQVQSVSVNAVIDVGGMRGENIMDTMLFNSRGVLTYDHIPEQLDIKVENNCVMDVFVGLYSPYIKRLTPEWFAEQCCLYGTYPVPNPLDCLSSDSNTNIDKVEIIRECGVSSRTIHKICQVLDISCYAFDIQNQNFIRYISKSRNYKPFVFYAVNRHCYVVIDSNEVKSLIERSKPVEHKIKSIHINDEIVDESKVNPYEDKDNILENIPVQDLINYNDKTIIYTRQNLNDILLEVFDYYKYVPNYRKMKYHEHNCMSLYFNYNNCNLVLSADFNVDIGWRTVYDLCDKLNTPFTNQTFPTLVRQQRDKFFNNTNTRVKFTKQERMNILNHQKMCQMCGKELKYNEMEIDHISPLSSGGSNDIDNLQVLCKGCHFTKTKDEQDNNLYVKESKTQSTFNNQTREIMSSFHASMYAFVETINEKIPKGYNSKIHTIDINRCRTNILLNNEYDFPLFTVVDEPEEYKGIKKAGVYYVITEDHKRLFRGCGWYPLRLVMKGLLENIIKEDDIRYVIYSSLTTDKDYFKQFVESLNSSFGNHSKLAVNSLIGSFKPKPRDKHTLQGISQYAPEVFEHHLKNQNSDIQVLKTPNDEIYYARFLKQEFILNETEQPIYNEILAQEIINLYDLRKLIHQNDGVVLDVSTDSVSCVFKNELPFETIEENGRLNIKDYHYKNGGYKYKLENKDGRLKDPKLQNLKRGNDYYLDEKPKWNITPDPEMDDFTELVYNIIESKKSYFLKGRGGCGKTHLVNMLKSEMEQRGLYYKVLAPTNKAANLVDGSTIHKFIKSVVGLDSRKLDYIFIDEISMVQETFYNYFIFIKRLRPSIKFIIAGDFNQLPPVKDRVNCDYENSIALKELTDNNMIHLSICRRADKEYFDLTDPDNVMKIDKTKFNNKECEKNLCYTNEVRKIINTKWMNKIGQKKKNNKTTVLEIPKLEYDGNSQDMKVYKDLPLIARINCKKMNLINNEEFIVKEIRKVDNTIIVYKVESPEITLTVPVDKFSWCFYPAYAISIHKSQGSTYKQPYTIYEWEKLNRSLRYVALSRACSSHLVNIL